MWKNQKMDMDYYYHFRSGYYRSRHTSSITCPKKNDDDDEKEEQNPEPTTENTQEEIAEYDQLCLLLQLSSFAGKKANSFSPRAEPNETLREDGVFVKTDINFGNTFPNSYLDIYYPGPIEEDRPTYIMEVDIYLEIKI